jgi:hypothetical protein
MASGKARDSALRALPAAARSNSKQADTSAEHTELDGWGSKLDADDLDESLPLPDSFRTQIDPSDSSKILLASSATVHRPSSQPEQKSPKSCTVPPTQNTEQAEGQGKFTQQFRHTPLQQQLPATPPGGLSRRANQQQLIVVPDPSKVALSKNEVSHVSDRMSGRIAVAAGGAKPGPSLNRLYAAAAELESESDEEDITPAIIAARMKASSLQESLGSPEEQAITDKADAERALEIARNADFLKVLAGKKKKLAAWNHAGEQAKEVIAFEGQGHSLSFAPSTPSTSGHTAIGEIAAFPSASASSVRDARLAALARRGL